MRIAALENKKGQRSGYRCERFFLIFRRSPGPGAISSAGRVEKPAYFAIFAELIVALYRFFRLQHVGLHALLIEIVEGVIPHLQSLVNATGEDDRLAAVLQQFLHVGNLYARRVTGAGLAPVPFARTARIQLGVLEPLLPVVDLDATPRKIRNLR